ncbi:hypothetical protein [Metabacillus malikii]|nr:hypothetical protein [Metabacillus malikii]
MLELLIYMMIGIFYTVYKLKELKRYEIILVSVLWPLDFLLNFIKLVDSVKNRNRQL